MTTIKDLVNKLNSYVVYGEFYIRKGKNDNYLLCKRYELSDDLTLFEFAKKQPFWSIYSSLGSMHNQVQEDIMDFVYTTDSSHWFDEQENKYNIIIGKDVNGEYKSAYRKCWYGAKVIDNTDEDDLTLTEFQFTESEIDDLKAGLPEKMAKIVDLGKVEVTNED